MKNAITTAKAEYSLSSSASPIATETANNIGRSENIIPTMLFTPVTIDAINPPFCMLSPKIDGFCKIETIPNNKPDATIIDNGPIKVFPNFCILVLIFTSPYIYLFN